MLTSSALVFYSVDIVFVDLWVYEVCVYIFWRLDLKEKK